MSKKNKEDLEEHNKKKSADKPTEDQTQEIPGDKESGDQTAEEECAEDKISKEDISEEKISEDDEPGEADAVQEELDALKQENSELKDQYLRKHADFENFRKRMAREKADSVKYGNQELLKDLIEVIDNFDRAIKSSEDSQDFNSFKEGISMIEQQFTKMLESKWNLKKMESRGIEYDPNSHEALMMEESTEIEVPTVLEDFQAGYMLYDRVLRPAKVKVGKPIADLGEEMTGKKQEQEEKGNEGV